jgi:hypothetical protein
MAIKYIKIFQSKTLQNLPNWDFWFENKPSGNPAPIGKLHKPLKYLWCVVTTYTYTALQIYIAKKCEIKIAAQKSSVMNAACRNIG